MQEGYGGHFKERELIRVGWKAFSWIEKYERRGGNREGAGRPSSNSNVEGNPGNLEE